MVVSCHGSVGNPNQILWKGSQCSKLPNPLTGSFPHCLLSPLPSGKFNGQVKNDPARNLGILNSWQVQPVDGLLCLLGLGFVWCCELGEQAGLKASYPRCWEQGGKYLLPDRSWLLEHKNRTEGQEPAL